MHLLTMLCKPHEVMEYLVAVLTLVDSITSVGVYVCPEVVSSGIPVSTYVTGKGFLPGVYTHVPTEVGGAYELTPTHITLEGSFHVGFGFLDLLLHGHVGDDDLRDNL